MNSVRVDNVEVCRRGDTVTITLEYPRVAGNASRIEVDLSDVRAADGLLIEYDFERDGWSIKQASRFAWASDEEPDPDWQEVAFVQAWAQVPGWTREEIAPDGDAPDVMDVKIKKGIAPVRHTDEALERLRREVTLRQVTGTMALPREVLGVGRISATTATVAHIREQFERLRQRILGR